MQRVMTERTGGCACGAIRFRITGPLLRVGVCHCTDCQKASGGPPNYVALALDPTFEVVKGEAKAYITKSDSGNNAARMFCSECGSPWWSEIPESSLKAVKLGALDHNSDLTPTLHLYVSSAAPWHLMHEGLPAFPKMPPQAPPGA